jgi:hypothetical protein
LRKARVCYDHLAGELGVTVYDSLDQRGALTLRDGQLGLTDSGWSILEPLGIRIAKFDSMRREPCRACLDWSERRHHLAGAVGAALMQRMVALRWARQRPGSRVIKFTSAGERLLRSHFPTPGQSSGRSA